MDDDDEVATRFAQLLTMLFAGRVVTYKGDGRPHVVVRVFDNGMLRIIPVGEPDLGIKVTGHITTPDQVS